MFFYEVYEIGKVYGFDIFKATPEILTLWAEMFPEDTYYGTLMPPGLVPIIHGNAYRNVIAPRPPGHVLGSQSFTIYNLPEIDSCIKTQVKCDWKQIKKERKWVCLSFDSLTETDVRAFSGTFTTLVPE